MRIQFEGSARVADKFDEGISKARSTAFGNGHAPELQSNRDKFVHEARGDRVGAEAGVQNPGREESVNVWGLKRLRKPVAAGAEQFCSEFERTAHAHPPQPLRGELRAIPGPKLGTEQTKCKFGFAEKGFDFARPGAAVARSEAIKFQDIGGLGRGEEGAAAVGEERCGGIVGVQVRETASLEIFFEDAEGCGAREKGMPTGIKIVDEAGLGNFCGTNVAPEPGIAFEDADFPSGFGEEGSAGEGVEAAADEDGVKGIWHGAK